jgi:hypothetical protein
MATLAGNYSRRQCSLAAETESRCYDVLRNDIAVCSVCAESF